MDPGSANCRNIGDVAMLQVAIARLGALGPDTEFLVLTDDAGQLARHCPSAHPVLGTARRAWVEGSLLPARAQRRLPPFARELVLRSSRAIRRVPPLWRALVRLRERADGRVPADFEPFMQLLSTVDLYVVCGQATVTDADHVRALRLLDTADLAIRAGKPVVMFGQGVGPLSNPALTSRARAVLPRIRSIALREEAGGKPVLIGLGVPSSRIVFTGDDAVEPAYQARSQALGTGLGVHLRIAPLAVTDPAVVERLRTVLQAAAWRHRAPMIPLPISHHPPPGAYDPGTIRTLLAGCGGDVADGGVETDSPAKVIAAAGKCRVVVTGAYHAAVFALAQGVSTVCLGRTEYYLQKFRGLTRTFGAGCVVIRLDDPELEARLAAAIDGAWDAAPAARPALLAEAERQSRLGAETYASVCSWVRSS